MFRYYAYIAVPAGDLRKRVLAYENQYQGNSRSLPHITLISPIQLTPEVTETALVAAVRNAGRDYGTVPIQIKGVGHFNEYRNVHYCVTRSKRLLLLAKRVKESVRTIGTIATSYRAPRYHPHITLAQGITRDQGMELTRLARKTFTATQFGCDRIFLLRIAEGGTRWQKIATVTL